MAKKRHLSALDPEQEPEVFTEEIPVEEEVEATAAGKKYVGPAYKYGITIPGTTQLLHPAEMDEDQQHQLIRRYPPAAAWWQ